jgi:arabinofuranosyltransferase
MSTSIGHDPEQELMRHEPGRLTRWLLIGGVVVLAAGIFLWSNTPYDIDDAPITYRYARNIAEGNGFVYNIGERILGTSTPLFTLVLAALHTAGIPIPLASNALNLVASVAVVAVTMALVRELTDSFWTALLAGLMLLVQDSFVRYSMAGMETPVYTLLIFSSILSLAKGQSLLSAALAGLAVLMRLDGLAIAGAILLACAVQQRRLPLREMAIVAIILTPWVVFSTAYFGSPIPLSMLAKQQHLQSAHASRYWIWEQLFVHPLYKGLLLLPFIALGSLWYVRKRAASATWLALTSWLSAYLVAYTLVGIDFYEWYLVPALPALVCFAAVGLTAVWEAAGKWLRQRPLAQVMLFAAFLAILLGPYVWHAYLSVKGFKGYLMSLEHTRVVAGDWLDRHSDPASRVLAGAIGHLGYTSNRYIIDGAGLVTPAKLRASLKPDFAEFLYPTSTKGCGPVKDFDTGWPDLPRLTISRCSETKGIFDSLVLAEVRITNWVIGQDGTWHREDRPYLETQWLLPGAKPDHDWTLYVHFTQNDGTIVAQADHLLGSKVNEPTAPTTQWPADQRIYDYVPLPPELEAGIEQLEVRVGVWDPVTAERLSVEPVHASRDSDGRLVIELQ